MMGEEESRPRYNLLVRSHQTTLVRFPIFVLRRAELCGVDRRRALRDAGTSFSELVDRTRRAMATDLLADRSLAIYEIAFLLGYSEPSTFYRAFRRWTGTSPREYRDASA
jgi:transcriptional regulator GlxA family with amidase domain